MTAGAPGFRHDILAMPRASEHFELESAGTLTPVTVFEPTHAASLFYGAFRQDTASSAGYFRACHFGAISIVLLRPGRHQHSYFSVVWFINDRTFYALMGTSGRHEVVG